ncbi:MAG: hypothetical protein NC182_01560 [Prevotella sp.]|nr:hypothetical protein [Staphylococcus sp.]MCM1349869.1 hypothetical protein [Prevotella sp.]
MKRKKLNELSSLKTHISRRILYFSGFIFLYFFPMGLIAENLFVLKKIEMTAKETLSITWCIAGLIYLVFLAKHLKKKILDLKPSPFKTFIGGIVSLIPVTILAAFVQLIQDLLNKMPKLDIAKHIWLIIFSICMGLCLQIVDAAINRKYLYDLEIDKEARKIEDIQRRRDELRKEREEMEE